MLTEFKEKRAKMFERFTLHTHLYGHVDPKYYFSVSPISYILYSFFLWIQLGLIEKISRKISAKKLHIYKVFVIEKTLPVGGCNNLVIADMGDLKRMLFETILWIKLCLRTKKRK